MTATGTTSKRLKIIPGRGLDGKDIKARLRNRTLEGQVFGKEAYTLDNDMVQYTKMSRVEQIEAAKANSKLVKQLQETLAEKQRLLDERHKQDLIEKEVAKRIQQQQTQP